MKPKVIKTELGWEPAFWYKSWTDASGTEHAAGYIIEPGFALPTKKEAEAALEKDLENSRRIEAQERIFASQMAYACGYRD